MNRRTFLAAALPALLARLNAAAQMPPPYPSVDVVVPFGPPRPRVEPPPPPPGSRAEFIWQPGYWYWDGRAYLWYPGRWVARPHRRAVWVPGHWLQRRYGWVWVPGHWR